MKRKASSEEPDTDSGARENNHIPDEVADTDSAPVHVEPITIILDLASLEIVKTKKGDFQLLNCDDHISLMKKHGKDPQIYRPDIIHQELMAVLDRFGIYSLISAMYVHLLQPLLLAHSIKQEMSEC